MRRDTKCYHFIDKGLWIEAESSDTVLQQLLMFKNMFSCTNVRCTGSFIYVFHAQSEVYKKATSIRLEHVETEDETEQWFNGSTVQDVQIKPSKSVFAWCSFYFTPSTIQFP